MFHAAAPAYSLDVPSYISIEYPLRVNNADKAIDMVGGPTRISECFIDPDMDLQLKLRPGDPYSHPINSAKIISDENALFKIRIPKSIMEKHRGDVRAAIEECETVGKKYIVEPVGMLGKTYRFRSLADFQMLTRESRFTTEFDQSLNEGNLDKIKQFSTKIRQDFTGEQHYKNTDMDIPPLVRYARADVPFNYRYTGNLLLDESGEWQNKAVKLHTIFVDWGVTPPRTFDPVLQEEYDKAVRDYSTLKQTLPARLADESPVYYFLECIKLLRKLFDMKPIWLRRHIHWMLPEKFRTQLRYALPYVAYTTTKGPWRQSFIKFGYDPSKDPDAAPFQVEAFRSNRNHVTDNQVLRMLESGEDVYIIPQTLYPYIDEFSDSGSELNRLQIGKVPRQFFFDGENPTTVVSFQIGDIMDEDVKQILRGAKLGAVCHEGSGWYDWVTICRLRAVVKYKLGCINEGRAVSEPLVVELSQRTQFSKNQYAHIRPKEGEEEEEGEEEGEGGEVPREDEENDREVAEEDEEEEESRVSDEQEDNGKAEAEIAEDNILKRLETYNPESKGILDRLQGLVKQEDLMDVGWKTK
ncbi:DEKNAAC103860 [Brettanomyces naardenensis]|uniref:DEKNAAC103860 n=1 Tax=Brettanomyces naardenensis TaxID=13370 RepID=A0A448YPE2_BRENA|nr:DEKNAAC103860 [Brettanomyces naardenensis]